MGSSFCIKMFHLQGENAKRLKHSNHAALDIIEEIIMNNSGSYIPTFTSVEYLYSTDEIYPSEFFLQLLPFLYFPLD